MISSDLKAQLSDTTNDDSSNEAKYNIINYVFSQ